MSLTLPAFVARWLNSGAEERANKDLFFTELCDVLEIPRPNPKTGDPARDTYVFEKDVRIPHEGATTSIGKVDLYKEGHVLVEAKQGKGELSKKIGSAKRDTPAWNVAMASAYGQALGYARTLENPPPFLVTADLGYCFDVYAAFDGTPSYRPFPNAMATRLFFADLDKHADTLRRIFLDPHGLDPAKQSAKVTREVAAHLADLAKALEEAHHPPESVATFLMRCIFTMFAEDVGLLPPRLFTDAIEKLWMQSPASFPGGIEALWLAMNTGTTFGFVGKLLRFNGGLFAQPTALPLTRDHLALLLEAAKCNWADVEPAIFGTLLERALNPAERHALGAHYTPRAYVERLVRPTIEEPLRADWEIVQAEVRQLIVELAESDGADELTEADIRALGAAGARKLKKTRIGQGGARTKKLNEAKAALHAFHKKLTTLRVLDPACGSGNFLYVTLDLFKRLEAEVLAALEGLGDRQELLRADAIRVTPAQFLGIEVKRWAKEIAELVLWIGYLQHHFRTYGKTMPVPEPVLQDYQNIECRDAVLAWDKIELVRDERGKPVVRWNGETTKTSPVTGEKVPDEKATVSVYHYINPRKASWPKADFVVGNPPFLGKLKVLSSLGEGYVQALREAHKDEVPDAADFVMYWWHTAAELTRTGELRQFGFVTTNSITQPFNRAVVAATMDASPPLRLSYALPDHPWAEGGAAVRVAMTLGTISSGPQAVLATCIESNGSADDEDGAARTIVTNAMVQKINANLTSGVDVTAVTRLSANRGLSHVGVGLHGSGFALDKDEALKLIRAANQINVKNVERYLRPTLNGRDLAQTARGAYFIDLFGLSERDAQELGPIYQHVLERVKPERDQNRRELRKRNWWLFGENAPNMRLALDGLRRYIGTTLSAKHRTFQFLDLAVIPDQTIVVVASDDASRLTILSSRIHVVWAAAAGGRLGVGNDLRYLKAQCFDAFAFPVCTPAHQKYLRTLGEQLDTHRKRQQAAHPSLTFTGMYNVLEKLRSGELLGEKDKILNEQGLVSVLRQIHDDLDAAVFDAYGWPHDLTDEQILEKLVALNAERAEEERNGQIRWLRPDFQNPGGKKAPTQETMAGAEGEVDDAESTAAAAQVAWSKKLPEQIAAVRDLVLRGASAWSSQSVAAAFKGVSAKGVEPVLESLAALGLIVGYEAGGEQRWRAARAGA